MERRSRRSRQQWKELIDEQAGSGLSARAYCEAKAIGPSSFYQWRRRLRHTDAGKELGIDSKDSFIDMGQIGSSDSSSMSGTGPWVVTLELGDGLKLTLQRG